MADVNTKVDTRVAILLNDLSVTHASMYELMQAIRHCVHQVSPDVMESVKYGGIMFAAPLPFCGVFAYRQHVSIEFGRGWELDDPLGLLEGGGKYRRHIKVRGKSDLKKIQPYIAQACAKANDK